MTDLFRTIIIPAQHITLARTIAASFGPAGGRGEIWVIQYADDPTHTIGYGMSILS